MTVQSRSGNAQIISLSYLLIASSRIKEDENFLITIKATFILHQTKPPNAYGYKCNLFQLSCKKANMMTVYLSLTKMAVF